MRHIKLSWVWSITYDPNSVLHNIMYLLLIGWLTRWQHLLPFCSHISHVLCNVLLLLYFRLWPLYHLCRVMFNFNNEHTIYWYNCNLRSTSTLRTHKSPMDLDLFTVSTSKYYYLICNAYFSFHTRHSPYFAINCTYMVEDARRVVFSKFFKFMAYALYTPLQSSPEQQIFLQGR